MSGPSNAWITLVRLDQREGENKGLKDDVGVIASATLIGAIGVVMTPRAAESIATMEGVVRVMRAR